MMARFQYQEAGSRYAGSTILHAGAYMDGKTYLFDRLT
jgi:hypothetical protein